MKKTMSFFESSQKKLDKPSTPVNFNKSSKKFAIYDTLPKPKQHIEHQTLHTTSSAAFLDNLKKIPNKLSQFRQTLNYKIDDQVSPFTQQIKNRTNKPVNILRQTINLKPVFKSKPEKTVSESFSEYTINLSHDSHPKTESNIVLGHTKKIINTITECKSQQSLHILKEQEKIMRQELSKVNQKTEKWKNHSKQFWGIQQKQKQKYKGPKLMQSSRLQLALQQLQCLKKSSALCLSSPRKIYENKAKNQETIFIKKKRQEKTPQVYSPQLKLLACQQKFKEGICTPSTQYSSNNSISISPANQYFQVIDPKKKITKLAIGQFNIEKNLGQGRFGLVMRVKHKKTGFIFALKKIPKDMIRSHFMIDQLTLQIKIQSFLNHKNILGIHGIFDDRTHLYLILDYMEQGTLYSQLKKQKILSERQTIIIIKQITQAVEYLHSNNIAHRDIKPQNIVISHNVCKLCDFGWATICNQRRKTYCGTLDYSAPQILEGKEYDMSVDLWCLGVMTYQLMTGKAPFYHVSRKETVKKILAVQTECILYPQSMSPEAVDFIQNLVRKDPGERMSAHEALKHKFLQKVKDQ